MPMETRSNSALFKRAEQLKRWEDSDTNKESVVSKRNNGLGKIKFTDGCVFLAACASGDTEEVERLLEKGADINTANVDGLTALHQACIDDNLKMVEFLVEHGCDVNQGDNEGWTPLHATASCGFLSIAKYLLENGASVAMVNNDGELPIDIAESEEMEELLQAEIDELGLCASIKAIQLFVLASVLCQGILCKIRDILSLLIKAGLDLNIQDNDGWTPLHAAAHWAQKEACELLADNLANMDIQNFVGQTCFDVVDPDLVNVLQDLKNKQNNLQKERPELGEILRRKAPPPLKRRTSVTRMSGTDKSNVVMKDTYAERAQIEAQLQLPEEEIEEEGKIAITNEVVEEPSFNTKLNKEDLNVVKRNEANIDDSLSEIIPSPDKTKEDWPPILKSANDKLQELQNDVAPWRRKIETNIPSNLQDNIKEPLAVFRKPQEVQPEVDDLKANGPTSERATEQRQISTEENLTYETTCATTPSTQSSPPIGVTTPPLDGQIRRSFVPPVRDEESETRRKAHAKRVRETRRSTTGVTLEDLKSAEQQLLRKQQEEDEQKEKDSTEPVASIPLTAYTTTTTASSTLSSTVDRQESCRISTEGEEKTPDVKPQDIPSTTSSPVLTTGSETTTICTSQEPQICIGPDSPEVTHSVTFPLRSRPVHNEDPDKDHENKNAQGTQAAIQRKRRPKRRSTGVVYWDAEEKGQQQGCSDQELQQEDDKGGEESQESENDVKFEINLSMSYGSYGSGNGRYGQGNSSFNFTKPSSSSSATGYASYPPYGTGSSYSPNYGGTVATTSYNSFTPSSPSARQSYRRDSGSYSPSSPRTKSPARRSAISSSSSFYSPSRESSAGSYAGSLTVPSYGGNDSTYSSWSTTPASPKFSCRSKRGNKTLSVPHSASPRRSVSPTRGYSLSSSKSSDSLSGGYASSSDSYGGYKPSSEPQRSHFGSAGSQNDSGHSETLSQQSDRLSRNSLNSSTGSLAEEGDQDYKKVYETLKTENERLKEKLKKTEEELVNTKRQLEKAFLQNHTRNSINEAEKRERRTLERKLAEMEEELKQLEQVKAENQRLRDENGALIRVISKLSK
ncbi:protein phosphatase 1 regulatory subunit 12C-like [Limulus polyphemus]|uniref:Protein phosphatase 1 regulatory subunit 12C-like n=1 Tax=Limulus polyphemus TaxID=6850 RepID=A0ABM1TIF6_LIMPO|nr:protein phosphatase 1 regulatory subunit 12C-like [Limulus polyphemus]